MEIKDFIVGVNYHFDDIRKAFHNSMMGGINISRSTKTIVITSKHYGQLYYADKMINGLLYYTGHGQTGDQEMTRGNKAIRDADKNGYKIHLFMRFNSHDYTYYGIYKLVKDPYIEKENDINGNTRNVYKFVLGKFDDVVMMTKEELEHQITSGPIKPVLNVVGACIETNGKILCAKRGYGSLINKWEFPGGKIKPGESHKQALQREIKEELDIDISVDDFIGESSYEYDNMIVNLSVYRCKHIDGKINDTEHKELKWSDKDKLKELDWADADIPIVDTYIEEESYKIDKEPVSFEYLEIKNCDKNKLDPKNDPRSLQDYEKSARSKTISGAKAEIAVLNYEKDKLLEQGKPGLAQDVERVSLKSSDFGYDIKSYNYDEVTQTISEMHIEVKKVNYSGQYITFFISANELDRFKNDKLYYIYCVFKYGKSYKVHIIDKNMFSAASVKPLTYQVKLKVSMI